MGDFNDASVIAAQLEKVRTVVPTMFERDDTFYSTIPVRTDVEIISNRDMRLPLEMNPGGKFAHFNPDGGSMGAGSGPVFDKAVVGAQFLRHNVSWTKKAEWGTDDPRKAVVKALRHLLSTAMADFRRHIDCLCMTNGQGILGTVSAVSNAGGFDTVTLATDGYGSKLLRFSQDVAYFDSTLATNRTTGTDKEITYWDLQAKQIKTATTAGLTAGDKVVVGGLGNVTGTNVISLFGVPYHHNNASTGFWLGLDRATYPQIRANRVNANGTLALPFPRRAINMIGDRLGRDQMKKLSSWMHPCQKQAYEEMGQQVSILNKGAGEESLDLYYGDNMQMAGAKVMTHYSWDKTRIDFIAKEMWGRAQVKAPDFYEVDGRKIFELRDVVTGGVKTSQIFHLCVGFQMFQTNPGGATYIDGLTTPTGY